jgi:hypothetical protein
MTGNTATPQERRIDRLHSVPAGQGLTWQLHLVREEDEAIAAQGALEGGILRTRIPRWSAAVVGHPLKEKVAVARRVPERVT